MDTDRRVVLLQAGSTGSEPPYYTAITPFPFMAGDLLGMQWGSTAQDLDYLNIQAYLVVIMGG